MRHNYGELAAVAVTSGLTAGLILTAAGALLVPGMIADRVRHELTCTSENTVATAALERWVEAKATIDGNGNTIESVATSKSRLTGDTPADATVATRDGKATLTARYVDASGDTHQCTDTTVVGVP